MILIIFAFGICIIDHWFFLMWVVWVDNIWKLNHHFLEKSLFQNFLIVSKKKIYYQTFFLCITFLKRRVDQNPRWPIYYQLNQLKINSKKLNHHFLEKSHFLKNLIVKLFFTYFLPPSLMHKIFVNEGFAKCSFFA